MAIQSLLHYAEYNDLINDVYGKLKFSSYRNNLDMLWMKNSVKNLDSSISKLISFDIWTKKEEVFLKKLKNLINNKSTNNCVVKITVNQAEQIIELSIDALIERDELVQEEIYGKEDYKKFVEALNLLDANEKLLKLIKKKLERSDIEQIDIDSMNEVADALTRSYLFLSGKIKDSFYLESSSERINGIWRQYHPLEKIEVV